jgi:Short C-terminal domain
MSIGEELENLARLRDQGVLSEDEFVAAKGRLLAAEPDEATQPTEPTSSPGASKRLRREWTSGRAVKLRIGGYVVLGLVVIVGGIVYGRMDVLLEPANATRSNLEERESLAERNEKAREEAARRFAIYSSCKGEIGPLLSALSHLDARLDVGLTFQEYGTQVGDVSVKYRGIAFARLHPSCTAGAGVAAENAFNAYIRSYNKWNSCIGDFYCSTDSIEPELQSNWSTATAQIGRARRALKDLLI